MAGGGPRPGAGAPKGNKNRAKKIALSAVLAPGARPKFKTAHEFGIWALNAPDDQVPMDQKMRAMQVLAPLEAKQGQDKPAPAKAPADDIYKPREVRRFGVVPGGR